MSDKITIHNTKILMVLMVAVAIGFTAADSLLGFDISDNEMKAMYVMAGMFGLGPHIIQSIKDGRTLSVNIEDMTKALNHPDVKDAIKKIAASN